MLLSPALALALGNRPKLLSVHFHGIQELHPERTAPLVMEIRPFAPFHCSSLDLWYFYNF